MAGPERIAAVRHFSRFYTRKIGVLHEGLLDSPFSLTEARIIYELAHHETATAAELTKELGLDASYVSRILKGFFDRGLILRRASQTDGRETWLSLTAEGQEHFVQMNARSDGEVGAILDCLPGTDQHRLVTAMADIEALLGGEEPRRAPYILRPHQIGDIGWVIQRHGVLYAQAYQWDETFEAFVAEIAATFVLNFDRKREACWIAEKDGENVGSVFLARESDDVAKLRMLLVEPKARGLGIGKRLVAECIRAARLKGYKKMTLWTNDILIAARQIYRQAGFTLVETTPHHSFGQDLIGENWQRDL